MSFATENTALVPTASRPLRLATLVRLRWLAVGGQSLTVLIVIFELGFALPLLPVSGLIVLSVLLNLMLVWRFGEAFRPGTRFAAGQLAYDLLQIGGLLYLTGGLENPFALLLMAPLAVSATTLPQRATVWLLLLYVVVVSVLARFHLPLPWDIEAPFIPPPTYIFGVWVALVSGAIFVTAYTNRVAHEARQLFDAFAATELALSRQHELNALDGLAAAAAHELGTPLSTIALAAREMRADIKDAAIGEDVDLIIEQTGRCRSILGKLRSLHTESPDLFAVVPIGDLLAEVARPFEQFGKAVSVTTSGGSSPMNLPRNIGLLYGLGNLIENATGFAETKVEIAAEWDVSGLIVTITDDGPGFHPDLIARLGEPYLSTRAGDDDGRDPAQPGGLGLGVFIAKTLLERTGASIRFRNASPHGHARVQIAWPRRALDQQLKTGVL